MFDATTEIYSIWFKEYIETFKSYSGNWSVTEEQMKGFAQYLNEQGYDCDYKEKDDPRSRGFGLVDYTLNVTPGQPAHPFKYLQLEIREMKR